MQPLKIAVYSFYLVNLCSILMADKISDDKKSSKTAQKETVIFSAAFASLPGNTQWNQTSEDYFLMFRSPSSENFEISEIFQVKKFHTKDHEKNLFPEDLTQTSFVTQGRFEKSNFTIVVNSASDKVFYSNDEVNFFTGFFYPVSQTRNSSFSLGIIYASGNLYNDRVPQFPIPFFSYYYMNDEFLVLLGLASKIKWNLIPKYLTLDLDGQPLMGNYSFSISSFPFNFLQIKGIFTDKEELFSLAGRENTNEKFAYGYMEAGLEISFFLSRYSIISLLSGYRFECSEKYYVKDNFLSSERIRVSSDIPDSWNYQAMIKIMF